jgi:hypothetical protein
MSAGARCRMIKSALDGDRDCTGTPIKAIHLLAGGLSDGGRARARASERAVLIAPNELRPAGRPLIYLPAIPPTANELSGRLLGHRQWRIIFAPKCHSTPPQSPSPFFAFARFFGPVVWTAVKVLVGINTRRLAGCWPSGREKIFAPFASSRFRFADKKWTRGGL